MESFSQNSITSSSTFEEISNKQKPISSIMSSSSSSFHLHSVQKSSPPSKSSKKSAAAAADHLQPPSKQPRVYKVKPIHFRQLVQQLTGAPEFQQPANVKRLQSIAPPSLQLNGLPSAHVAASLSSYTVPGAAAAGDHVDKQETAMSGSGGGNGMDFLGGLTLSPSFQAWCSAFALLSPGSLDLSNGQDQQRTSVNFN